MQLRNTTTTDMTLASGHVIKAGDAIAATDGVMQYPDNRIALARDINNGTLVLEKPEPKKAFKVKHDD